MKLRFVTWGSALLLLIIGIWLLTEPEAGSPIKPVQSNDRGLPVTIVNVVPENTALEITAVGITRARWETDLIASVDSRVVDVKPYSQPGSLVAKGMPLVTLLDTYYRAGVEQAKARVADAELELARIRNEQHVAQKAGEAQSDFGRYEPHLKAANTSLLAARAALDSARQQLQDTQISVAFPAVILTEHVAPGQWVNAGDRLFRVASSESLDVHVALSHRSWQQLGPLSPGQPVKIITPAGKYREARIRYLSPALDAVTRQRSVVLEVSHPYESGSPLLPDQQVKAVFQGPVLHHIVRAPASVLTADGQVWSVIQNKLRLESVELFQEQPDHLLYRYRHNPEQQRQLVRFPLSTMLDGQRVSFHSVADQVGAL